MYFGMLAAQILQKKSNETLKEIRVSANSTRTRPDLQTFVCCFPSEPVENKYCPRTKYMSAYSRGTVREHS